MLAPYGPHDLDREAALRERVALAWKCTVVRFAELDVVDVRLERHGRTLAVAELKCRDRRYDDLMISDHKPPALKRWAAGLGVPGFIVVEFNDDGAAIWADVADVRGIRLKWRARRDYYGNLEPAEWVVFLDYDPFRPLEERPELWLG